MSMWCLIDSTKSSYDVMMSMWCLIDSTKSSYDVHVVPFIRYIALYVA